jgi:hypothetical protein
VFESFSGSARLSVVGAQGKAHGVGYHAAGPEQILIALRGRERYPTVGSLSGLGISPHRIRDVFLVVHAYFLIAGGAAPSLSLAA